MEPKTKKASTSRRNFLGTLATGAAAISAASLAPITAGAKTISENFSGDDDPDAWFKKLKGKHRIVFDATRPHEIMPFVWPAVFLMTNQATGTQPKDANVVVVLRHSAIGYAFEDRLWAKYNFGQVFKTEDIGPAFKAADYQTAMSKRNPFWKPKKGDFQVPGIGSVDIGINDLQDMGVMFCVCNAAMTVYSAGVAQATNMKADDVYNEWKAGVLPNIQIVPSGVWAVGRAQEHGCAYCFAG
jgi:intracellular sulfur oxidation DsrE/DsrF family protein